ncbi:MAG TPA: hypothetical protein PLK37_11330 [Terricaulis sp.]|nr:hypothetical protein [Terricaulis sp.]
MLGLLTSNEPEIKDENDKRREIKDYFRGKAKHNNSVPIGLMAIGGLILLGSLTSFNLVGILAGAALAAVGYFLFRRQVKTAAEEQIDAWFQEDLRGLENWSRTRTGIDAIGGETGEALYLTSFPDPELVKDTFFSKRGADGVWRVTPQAYTCFFFLENTMIAFQCEVDHATGNKINERYLEFFYQDIVTVASHTRTQTYGASSVIQAMTTGSEKKSGIDLLSSATAFVRGRAVDGLVQFNAEESFSITLSNGEKIPVRVSDSRFVDRDTNDLAKISSLQARVTMIRDRVREKKRSLRAAEQGLALI